MVGGKEPSDPFGPRTTDVRTLRHQRREARAVLDHQIETLDDVDDAALRTARIAAVMLALVLSAAKLSGPGAFWNLPIRGGALGLGCTFCIGVLTHGSSSVDLGPGPDAIDDAMTRPYSEREWLYQLLEAYADWIAVNRRVIHLNSLYLKVTQTVLLFSTVLLGVGAIRLTGDGFLPF